MKKENKKVRKATSLQKKKIVIGMTVTAILFYIIYATYLLIKQPTNIFTVEEGKLYQEET